MIDSYFCGVLSRRCFSSLGGIHPIELIRTARQMNAWINGGPKANASSVFFDVLRFKDIVGWNLLKLNPKMKKSTSSSVHPCSSIVFCKPGYGTVGFNGIEQRRIMFYWDFNWWILELRDVESILLQVFNFSAISQFSMVKSYITHIFQ